jgi:hypothetical protein
LCIAAPDIKDTVVGRSLSNRLHLTAPRDHFSDAARGERV